MRLTKRQAGLDDLSVCLVRALDRNWGKRYSAKYAPLVRRDLLLLAEACDSEKTHKRVRFPHARKPWMQELIPLIKERQ